MRLQAVMGAPAPLPDQSDAELARETARGSADALEELYNRYNRPVFSMAYGILKDYALAEDLTQEAFAALWTRAGRFDESRGVFRHWFLHLAHNRVLDELRRRRRIALVTADADPDDPALGLAAPEDTAAKAMTNVLFQEASAVLRTLPDEQRAALAMAYIEGATQQEIAQRVGVPLGTVKTRLRLGLEKLRQAMAPEPAREEA